MSLPRYVEWIRDAVLPCWLSCAADSTGLFFETLALDGKPNQSAELRLRTGMRQVYVFAEAGHLGLSPKEKAVDLAETIAARLVEVARSGGRPGWPARFFRNGTITDCRRDLYDHAFALLAMATLVKAACKAEYLDLIDETIDVIDRLASIHGGWNECDRFTLPRRQNPHMHLFESCLALYEATLQSRFLERAGKIFELFNDVFWDGKSRLLTEFFGPAWERSNECRSYQFDPGHIAEWCWLLRRYARASQVPVSHLCEPLYESACRLGRRESGFLVDEMDEIGRPIVDSCRLWPQTEFLKATIVEAEAQGRPELLACAEDFCRALQTVYIEGMPSGTWCDRINLRGERISTAIPASTLYHLLSVVPEILRLESAGPGSIQVASGEEAAVP